MPVALQIWVTEYLVKFVSLVEMRDSSSHCLMVCLFLMSGGLNAKNVLINLLDFKILALRIVNKYLGSFQLIPACSSTLLLNRK